MAERDRKVHTIFGGKNPHPNYLVGGVPCSMNNDANAINAERLAYVGSSDRGATTFVEQVYIPDLLAVLLLQGLGRDWRRAQQLPVLRRFAHERLWRSRQFQVCARGHSRPRPQRGSPGRPARSAAGEGIHRAFLVRILRRRRRGKHPWDGETELNYTGPKPPYEQLNVDGKYSWLKTPRWKDHAMEVGPLARLLVSYASGRADVKEVVKTR